MKDVWNSRYSGDEFYYGTHPNDFLVEQVAQIPANGKVLCLAEGEGRNAVYLAKQGFNVTAVDISETGLEKTKTLANLNGVSVNVVCADLAEYQLGSHQWDAIVSIWCHLPSQIRRSVYGQVAKSLVQNGVMILEAYRPEQLQFKTGGPSNPDFMPTLKNLQAELVDLNITFAQEIDRHVSEGKGHQGLSAVVQVVAKKMA